MSRFEDELWTQLVRDHMPGARYPAKVRPRVRATRPVQRRLIRRPLALTVGSFALLVCVTAALVVFSASSSPPAFAITTHPGGSISITIRQISGISGANRELARRGIPARAVPLRAIVYGCASGHELGGPTAPYSAIAPSAGVTGVTIFPTRLPPGDSVLIGAAISANGDTQESSVLVHGETPKCFSTAFLRALPRAPVASNATATTTRQVPPPRSSGN
jgi:hypothetical protein